MKNTTKDGLTVKEAEKAYGQKGHNIRRWIRDGHLKAQKDRDGYLIDRASLEAHLAKTQGPKIATAIKPEQAAVVTDGSQPTGDPATFPIPAELLAGIDAAVKQSEPQASQTPPPSSEKSKPVCDQKAGPKTEEERAIEKSLNDAIIQPSDDFTTVVKKQAMVRTLVERASNLKPQPAQGPLQPAPVAVRVAESGAAMGQKRQQPRQESKTPSSAQKQSVPVGKKQRKDERLEAGKGGMKNPVRYAKNAMRHLDLAQMRDVRDWLFRRMDNKMKPV